MSAPQASSSLARREAGQSLCAAIPTGGSKSFRIDARKMLVSTACRDAAGRGSTASLLLLTSPSLTTDSYCVTLTPAAATSTLTFTAGGLVTSASGDVVLDHIVAVSGWPLKSRSERVHVGRTFFTFFACLRECVTPRRRPTARPVGRGPLRRSR